MKNSSFCRALPPPFSDLGSPTHSLISMLFLLGLMTCYLACLLIFPCNDYFNPKLPPKCILFLQYIQTYLSYTIFIFLNKLFLEHFDLFHSGQVVFDSHSAVIVLGSPSCEFPACLSRIPYLLSWFILLM